VESFDVVKDALVVAVQWDLGLYWVHVGIIREVVYEESQHGKDSKGFIDQNTHP